MSVFWGGVNGELEQPEAQPDQQNAFEVDFLEFSQPSF